MAQTPQTAQTPEPYELTVSDVAERFAVDASTIHRWSDAGHLICSRTLGGHRRYRRSDVERFAVERLGQR